MNRKGRGSAHFRRPAWTSRVQAAAGQRAAGLGIWAGVRKALPLLLYTSGLGYAQPPPPAPFFSSYEY